MKKLSILVGHNADAQGARRRDTGESEYVWNGRLAAMMQDLAPEFGLIARVFRRTKGGTYSDEIRRVYNESDAWGAEGSVELHFNSHENSGATGTETLTSGTPASMRLAQDVQNEVMAALSLADRGIKTRREGRGSASLLFGKAPAIIVEPFFGSSPIGQQATDDPAEMEKLAKAILRGAARALNAMPRADLAQSRTIKETESLETSVRYGASGLLATLGLDASADIFATLQAAEDGLESILPLVQEHWQVLAVAVIVAAFWYYSRGSLEAIRRFRTEDHAKMHQ